jgi:cytochrome c oxidase subunit 2
MRYRVCLLTLVVSVCLGGCRSSQSVLSPRGEEAERVAFLASVLFTGAALIFAGVMAVALIAALGRGSLRRILSTDRLVVWGGLVFPLLTLTALLGYGLLITRAGAGLSGDGDPLRIRISGELWWWRIVYLDEQGRSVESANELRLPVGRLAEIALESTNVIHSFWVPNLAGKLDMIPGRTNVLRVKVTSPGISRGQCAEYCGGPHALMSLHVIAMPASEFQAWLKNEAGPAPAPSTPALERGGQLFLASGCGACHTIRGTPAAGRIGPDLTRIGSRLSIAAATLPMTEASLARWIRDSHQIKPQNLMPPYGIFSDADLALLTAYLASLR